MAVLCWTGDHVIWVTTWVLPVGLLYVTALVGGWLWALRRSAGVSKEAAMTLYSRFQFMWQGYALNRWYWELVHIVLVLVQVAGVVLLAGTGPAAAGAWAVVWCLVRLCSSALYRPYATSSPSSGLVQWADIVSSSGLVGSSMGYLYMSGPRDGLTCDAVGWIGSLIVCAVEVVVATILIALWLVGGDGDTALEGCTKLWQRLRRRAGS